MDGSGITNLSGGARPGRGLVTKITHADSPSNTYEQSKYDAYGNKRWEDNELRKATSYTYDDYNRLLSVTNPLGKTTGYDYAPSQGNVTQSRRHTSNSPYWITVPVNATTSILTSNVYDENFRKTSTTAASGTSEAATTWFHYDNVGNQDYVTDPRGAGSGDSNYTTYSDYDSRNRKWRVREPLNHTTIFGYDEGHNITEIRRPDNQLETKAYDAMNRLISHTVPKTPTVSLTTRFGYWPSGKLFWEQDPEGQTTYFGYNESDQMNLMYYPGLTQSQQWTYDDAHNLHSRTTVNGEIQSFAYDIRNRKTSMSWSNAADSATFTYYSDGRLKNAQNANSTVYREYDDAGRLTRDQQNVTGLGIKDVYYPSYDDSGKLTRMYVNGVSGYDYTFGYDEMGRFETIAPTNQSVAFQYYYDPASNEIQRRNYLSNPDLDQFYHRDNLSRIWQLEIKKGAILLGREDYGYDELNRLISTTREDNKQDQFDYYFDGELKTATYGRNSAPTPTPPASPTPAPSPTATPGGQVAEPSFAPPGTNIYPNTFVTVTISTTTTGAQIRYTLDGANWTTIANNGTVTFQPGVAGKTLTAIGFKAGLNDSDPHSEYYWYDSGRAPETIRTVTYHFDGAGNRTSVVDAGVTTPYTLDPNNNFNQYSQVGPDAVTNGSEHEISMYQNVSYAYINDEHLKSASGGATTYRLYYDALSRCVKRTVNGVTTYYIYDGEKPILEYRANDLTHPVRNVYGKGIDEILMRTDPTVNGAAPFYYQQDHEGSVTRLTNAVGSVIEKYRYDAFGLPTVYDGAGNLRPGGTIYKNRFLFTGREYATTYGAAFKFYEYRARAYNPILGRFMSEDPKLFDAGDYNLFRYCHNDPIDFTDPMGIGRLGSQRIPPRQDHESARKGCECFYKLSGSGK